MLHVQPPTHISPIHPSRGDGAVYIEMGPMIFLAGSIEMDKAERWQDRVVQSFQNKHVTFLNPRCDDWDPKIEQSCMDVDFRKQVNWEISGLLKSDLVIFYVDPTTKSPITLLELGLIAGRKIPSVVCCPDGFWRKGNVEMICDRFGIQMIDSFERLLIYIETFIEHWDIR
jgi:nucleoside 2-deoxyribosyltransferase